MVEFVHIQRNFDIMYEIHFRTDTDHTCYTIKTVGKDGFLELLPIYLDHILFPTLSDAGYITEVHHIAPNGEDSGVVCYCLQTQFYFE